MKAFWTIIVIAVIILGIASLAWVLYETYYAAINVLEAM